jgi:integrase
MRTWLFDTLRTSLITSLAAGVDVRTVAGRLGHRNASTTLNVYAHFVHDADEEAAAVLARLLEEGAGREDRDADT